MSRPRELKLEAARLEIASGYDGLFRGAPEAVIVVAAYALGHAARPETLFRAVWRAQPTSARSPQVASLTSVISAPRVTLPGAALPFILVAAVEDDDGGGIGAVMGALERADEISFATLDANAGAQDVVALRDVRPDEIAWSRARRVEVIVDGAALDKKCPRDDYVGASAFVIRKKNDEQRAHVVSADKLNDWTAVISSRLREK